MILIAICDDNKNVREDLRKLLIQYSFERKEDFKIFLFASSQEFCETLVEVEYQIVFLDVVMKGKDGIEVGKELRVRYLSSVTQKIECLSVYWISYNKLNIFFKDHRKNIITTKRTHHIYTNEFKQKLI